MIGANLGPTSPQNQNVNHMISMAQASDHRSLKSLKNYEKHLTTMRFQQRHQQQNSTNVAQLSRIASKNNSLQTSLNEDQHSDSIDTLIRPSLNAKQNTNTQTDSVYPSDTSANYGRPRKSIGITAQFDDLDLTPAPMLPKIMENQWQYGEVRRNENSQRAVQRLESQRTENRQNVELKTILKQKNKMDVTTPDSKILKVILMKPCRSINAQFFESAAYKQKPQVIKKSIWLSILVEDPS